MGCSDTFGTLCALGCFLGLSLALQGAGLFSPRWVTIPVHAAGTNNTTSVSDCHLGLVLSDCGHDAREPNKAVLGLQATSFAVILLTNISSFIHFLCCSDDDGPCIYCLGCSCILYPIAGLLTLIGCIISATEYSTSQFGWGFYCCIASGCFIMIETVCLCCVACIALRSDDDSPPPADTKDNYDRSVASPPYTSDDDNDHSVAVTQTSRDLAVDRRQSLRFAAVETEVRAVATSTGFAMVARQVTRMIHIRSTE